MSDWAFIPELSHGKDEFVLMQEAAEGIVGDFELSMLESHSAEAVEDKARTAIKIRDIAEEQE
jgi:hypothetical protein